MLSLLILAACSSLGYAIDTNYLFNSNRFPEASSVPTLSNGNIGFTVFSDSVYLTGVYNGRQSQSQRARIPNYANLQLTACSYPETSPPYCTYQLDIKTGRFRTVYDDPNNQLRLVHSVYPHRYYTHAIVNHIRFQRLNGRGILSAPIQRATMLRSADINFQPTENVTIQNRAYLYQCGRTNQVEDPVLQYSGTEVCVYFSEIPAAIELPADRTAEEFSFYTVFARSRAEAEEELQILSFRSVSNTEERHESHMAEMWTKYEITVDGNNELDRAIKASSFQLFSNVPVPYTFNPLIVKTYGISPSGIGRNEFQGHVMWDFDMFMLPIVLLADPFIARELLNYRTKSTRGVLDTNAAVNNYDGWKFPWASAYTGREVSPSPDAAKLQHHITGDVAFAIRQFYYATNDVFWLTERCELIYETAHFWKNRTIYNSATDKFDIPAVTGPDTTHPNVNNNVYTNAIAAHNLFIGEYAGCLCQDKLNIRNEDLDDLIRTAQSLHLLYDPKGDFNPQFEGYIQERSVGQADAVLIGYPLDIAISNSTKRRNLEVYGLQTAINASAMTWSMHTVGWLELNELNQAAESFHRSYQPYIRPPFNVWNQGATSFPGASNFVSGAASFLHTMIHGYAGIRLRDGELTLNRPRPPAGTTRLHISEINFNAMRFSLDVYQNGTFTITQKASQSIPFLTVTIDGESFQPCGVNSVCVYHGLQSASLKLNRFNSRPCKLKPTRMNMRLADQSHSTDIRASPIVFVTIMIAALLNNLF